MSSLTRDLRDNSETSPSPYREATEKERERQHQWAARLERRSRELDMWHAVVQEIARRGNGDGSLAISAIDEEAPIALLYGAFVCGNLSMCDTDWYPSIEALAEALGVASPIEPTASVSDVVADEGQIARDLNAAMESTEEIVANYNRVICGNGGNRTPKRVDDSEDGGVEL